MSEPLNIAFVWHMHQPYYRSTREAPFDMPWARMHALKDYLDMVTILGDYPDLHQTFNLVPSLVEQLETYATPGFRDIYWEHTMKPAADLTLAERTFIVERMCEYSDHPRPRGHPGYMQLALKRAAQAAHGWEACATAFTDDELRDLQIWFNLAWFDPEALEKPPLSDLVSRAHGFTEQDKEVIAQVQQERLAAVLPAYREAATRGQIELSTSPYFHPILPLLTNTDTARIAAPEIVLPRKRFAHPEDASLQLRLAVEKHEATFGSRPLGVWCSEQSVGEDVIPLLFQNGFTWNISDETVLLRSLSGVRRLPATRRPTALSGAAPGTLALYQPYRLEREDGALSIIFRDHTLSDLIGFAYHSWDSRDAAADLMHRLREIRDSLDKAGPHNSHLVTIALDGENAWEYYPRDGHDFLHYLYEALSTESGLRCVSVSEHLQSHPPVRPLDWLHTGSWIGGDLRTWIGDPAHDVAWELLHDARDAVASGGAGSLAGAGGAPGSTMLDEAWLHILAAEGSDWFWWFGEHHHTPLDAVWDLNFRRHLQNAYRLVGRDVPLELFFPILSEGETATPMPPKGRISPTIDGILSIPEDGTTDEWSDAGRLAEALPSTMQRAEGSMIREMRFGWCGPDICLLIVPDPGQELSGLEVQIQVIRPSTEDLVFSCTLRDDGTVRTECSLCPQAVAMVSGAWKEVVELSLPAGRPEGGSTGEEIGLVVRTGHNGMTEHVFHSARLESK